MRKNNKLSPKPDTRKPAKAGIVAPGIFINPFSDFGFKRFFCTKQNSDLSLDFLNAILEGERKITHIEMTAAERSGSTRDIRKVIHDGIGESVDSQHVLMEMQRARQVFVKARNVYYVAANIHEQLAPGDENFALKDVISICITNFVFDTGHPDQYVHTVKLITGETGEVFYNDLLLKYIEMPKFNKQEHELVTRLDFWLYALKNMQQLSEIPVTLRGDPVFEKLFEIARLTNLNKKEMNAYTMSQIDRMTLNLARKRLKEEAREEGREEGRAKGKEEGRGERDAAFVKTLLAETKFGIKKIASLAGVSVDFVIQQKSGGCGISK